MDCLEHFFTKNRCSIFCLLKSQSINYYALYVRVISYRCIISQRKLNFQHAVMCSAAQL